MQIESRLLSVHIEKTAGTSVQDLLESVLGKDKVLIYNPIADTLTRASDLRVQRTNPVHDALRLKIASSPLAPIINKTYRLLAYGMLKTKIIEISNLPGDFLAIHGHFAANRFDKQLVNPLATVVVRDPLERMESQYVHWQRTKGVTEWRVRIPFDPSITFERYALLSELQNYQTQALGGKNLDSFTVVGVTEELDTFAQELLNCLQSARLASPKQDFGIKRLNRTPNFRQSPPIYEQDFLRQFKRQHEADYLLYEQAKRRVKA